jgi:hypothetical protein
MVSGTSNGVLSSACGCSLASLVSGFILTCAISSISTAVLLASVVSGLVFSLALGGGGLASVVSGVVLSLALGGGGLASVVSGVVLSLALGGGGFGLPGSVLEPKFSLVESLPPAEIFIGGTEGLGDGGPLSLYGVGLGGTGAQYN